MTYSKERELPELRSNVANTANLLNSLAYFVDKANSARKVADEWQAKADEVLVRVHEYATKAHEENRKCTKVIVDDSLIHSRDLDSLLPGSIVRYRHGSYTRWIKNPNGTWTTLEVSSPSTTYAESMAFGPDCWKVIYRGQPYVSEDE